MDSAEGLVIVYARLRRPDIREDFWFRMENLGGERVAPTIFEISIADWDEGLWQAEIDWIQELLDGTRETVLVWQFQDGKYSRYAISGGEVS